jgi:hypothetical protein
LKIYLFLNLKKNPTLFPHRGSEIGFVNAPLSCFEVQIFKRSCDPLLEDPFSVSEQVDKFLGPQICTWAELMSILGILFSGEERP